MGVLGIHAVLLVAVLSFRGRLAVQTVVFFVAGASWCWSGWGVVASVARQMAFWVCGGVDDLPATAVMDVGTSDGEPSLPRTARLQFLPRVHPPLAATIVYFAERLNSAAHAHWRLFASQDYFDRNGIFFSALVSAPLLMIMFIILVRGGWWWAGGEVETGRGWQGGRGVSGAGGASPAGIVADVG